MFVADLQTLSPIRKMHGLIQLLESVMELVRTIKRHEVEGFSGSSLTDGEAMALAAKLITFANDSVELNSIPAESLIELAEEARKEVQLLDRFGRPSVLSVDQMFEDLVHEN